MAERLSFVGDAMAYASMLSAEHVSRYALVRELCAGRRVLDIACGEGYGSALMRSWGASEVVGVDISEEAITNASRMFAGDGVRFLQGDASESAALRESLGAFDLVVSFETLEHVPDAQGLLRGIKALSAAGGAIVISCPNDAAVLTGGPNHFHVRTYTFDEFRDTVTDALGEASSWVVGTSVLGFGAFAIDSKLLSDPPSDLKGLMTGADTPAAVALPAQTGHEVDLSNCAYYAGGWNCVLPQTSVVAPISFRAYESPYHNWVASKAEVDRLTHVLENTEGDCTRAKDEHAQDLRRLRLAGEITMAQMRTESEHAAALAQSRLSQLAGDMVAVQRLNIELAERLQAITHSRWHRAGQAYYGLYGAPFIGRVLRFGRRLVSGLRRRAVAR